MKQITVKVKGGTLRAIASSDPAYPGIWVEFIPDDNAQDEARSRSTVLMEKTDELGLRALIWADSQNEDYSHEICFPVV